MRIWPSKKPTIPPTQPSPGELFAAKTDQANEAFSSATSRLAALHRGTSDASAHSAAQKDIMRGVALLRDAQGFNVPASSKQLAAQAHATASQALMDATGLAVDRSGSVNAGPVFVVDRVRAEIGEAFYGMAKAYPDTTSLLTKAERHLSRFESSGGYDAWSWEAAAKALESAASYADVSGGEQVHASIKKAHSFMLHTQMPYPVLSADTAAVRATLEHAMQRSSAASADAFAPTA